MSSQPGSPRSQRGRSRNRLSITGMKNWAKERFRSQSHGPSLQHTNHSLDVPEPSGSDHSLALITQMQKPDRGDGLPVDHG